MMAFPIGKIVNISVTSKEGTLTSISDNKLYFDFGKGTMPYPNDIVSGVMFQNTILCVSKDEQEILTWCFFLTFWLVSV
jgi:hypothetical protein